MKRLLLSVVLIGCTRPAVSKGTQPAPASEATTPPTPQVPLAVPPAPPSNPIELPPDVPEQIASKDFRAEVVGIFASLPGLGRIAADDMPHVLALITGFRLVSTNADQAKRRVLGTVELLRRYSDDIEERYDRKTKRKLFDAQGRYADLAAAMRFAQQDMQRQYGSKNNAARVMADDMGGREMSTGFWAVDFALVERMVPLIAKMINE